MIPIPALLVVKTFVGKHWPAIALFVITFCIMALLMGVAANYVDRGWRAKMAKAQAEWSQKVADAERKTREAEARERAKETAWRDHVANREKEYRNDKTKTDAARAAERVAGDRLRVALDAFTRAGYASADTSAACGDLRRRVETLGLLVTRTDAFAGECGGNADACRDSLALCRGYAEALK